MAPRWRRGPPRVRLPSPRGSRPPSRPDLRRCERTPARRACGRGHPTRGRDAFPRPSRRPRTRCARPPSCRPPCCRSRRDVDRSLYGRSRAQTPHGAFTAATRRGTCPPQVLEAQGAVGCSRQVGPIRTAYDRSIRITMRGTGGLTTVLEKSLGGVTKAGTTNLVDVYEYAQPVTARGFVFMDTPGYDPVTVTGQVAGVRT